MLGAAQRADEVGQAGQDAVAHSLGELEQILKHVDTITRTMNELGESTSRIAGIAGLVKDLADQSNMLALNAAIEAVRSGEHGRGFAVVAREIRSLADQSIQATQRVQENLDAIRANAARAVNITEEGSRGIAANLTRVRGSGDSLREMGAIAQNNARAVREIAAAVGQQNAGIDQVFSAVRDLSSSMTDLVRLIEQSAASVREVGSVSARIGGIVSRFRCDLWSVRRRQAAFGRAPKRPSSAGSQELLELRARSAGSGGTLRVGAVHLAQQLQLLLVLHALRHHLHVRLLASARMVFDLQRLVGGADALHEAAVDLQRIDRELVEVAEEL